MIPIKPKLKISCFDRMKKKVSKKTCRGIKIKGSLERIITKRNLLFVILIFLSLFFLFIIFDGLPFCMQALDDFWWIEQGKSMSFSEITKLSFSQTNFLTETGSTNSRPVMVLVYKLINLGFGDNPFFFYVFKGLFLLLVCLFIYLFVSKITKNSFISIFAALFFLTIPLVIYSTMWISELEILAQLLLIIGFYFFLRTYSNKDKLTQKKFWLHNLIIILSLVLAVHTKETTKIAPLVLISYLVVVNWKKLIKASIVLIPLIYMVIPINFDLKSAYATNFDLVYSLFYHNTQTRFGAESASSLLSPTSQIINLPGSVVGSFGFFISWLFIISMIYFIFKIRKKSIIKIFNLEKVLSENWRYLLFVVIWSLISIAILGKACNDSRYIIATLLPFTILIFSSIWLLAQQIKIKKYRKMFKAVIFIFIIITILSNAFHSVFHVRGGAGGIWIQYYQAMEDIYYNERGIKIEYDNLNRIMIEDDFEGVTFSEIMFSDRSFHWYLKPDENEITQSLKNHTRVYVLSYYPDLSLNISNSIITPISEIHACKKSSEKSLFCKIRGLSYNVLGKKEISKGKLYLYRLSLKS